MPAGSQKPHAVSPAVAPPWLRGLVRWQDEAIRIPGTEQRLGFDAIIGFLFPGAGDLASAALSMAVVISAVRHGVPVGVLLRMVVNIMVDASLGSVPVLGDFFDVAFRASSKNLVLFERHGRAEVTGGARGRFARLVLLLLAIALTLLFVGAMSWILMGVLLGSLAWW